MSDPALPLQKAVFDALAGAAGVKARCGDPARVYDWPPMTPRFPYITIGEDQIIDDGTTCGEGFECFVTVHVWSREKGKPEAKAIGAAVRAALNVALPVAGFTVVEFEQRDARYLRDPDGVTEHGVLVFRYLIDPVVA